MATFQEIVAKLAQFWAKRGCVLWQPYDMEKGAGTFNPATFLRALGPEPFRVAYMEPSRRPRDGRYGTNPVRVQHYFQYQVILKPSPTDIQDLYLKSLEAMGFTLADYDIRFVHDDWEQPTLGAWGLGWEVWLDGLECSQFTYFQAIADMPLKPVTGELTYGLERLVMRLQKKRSMFDIQWNDEVTYGDLFSRNEAEYSQYTFDALDPAMWLRHFEDYASEVKRLVSFRLSLPAYDFVLKSSHAFNLLDAHGVISVAERAGFIARIRELAHVVATCYLEERKAQGFPLLHKWAHPPHQAPAPAQRKDAAHHTQKKSADFLLEVGSEELPASFVTVGLASLERQLRQLLEREGLSFEGIETMGTPRRLAVIMRGLQRQTTAQVIEKKGPAITSAFDANGAPTAAGEGFLKNYTHERCLLARIRAQEITGVEIRSLKGTEYLYAREVRPSVDAHDILQQALAKIIVEVDFPKKMRWADFDISYARPLRWIVALLDDEVIPFSVGPIHSGNTSYGHRQLAPHACTIHRAGQYEEVLKAAHVLVNPTARAFEVERQLSEIERATKTRALARERVSREVLHLVEWPYLALGDFDPDFLKAPREVLVSEMVEHQRYFPLADEKGGLTNQFVITANVPPTEMIVQGNRHVISARLSDGVFLFEQDMKLPLEAFAARLSGMIFQKGLGTMQDKAVRLQAHVKGLHAYFPTVDLQDAFLTAGLAKADLVTEMVHEFPELQGVMGRIYATRQGKAQLIATAIDEHWMPRGEKAPLPQTALGALLSIADKVDNLLGFFGIDLRPTSSSDPYALKRQGLGLVRILIDQKVSLPLATILPTLLDSFTEELRRSTTLVSDVIAFLQARARSFYQDLGFPKDEIEACLAVRGDDFYDVWLRLEAISRFRKTHASFQQLVEVHKRAMGQINGFPPYVVASALLSEPAEQTLHMAIEQCTHTFAQSIATADYPRALLVLAELQPAIASLFDTVKVLADDPNLQRNRLALLQNVAAFFRDIADFQKMQLLTPP